MTPQRIQRSRKHKQQPHPNGLPIKYAGRPTKFGNEFKIGQLLSFRFAKLYNFSKKDIDDYVMKELTAEDCIYLFEKYQLPGMDLSELVGKNLSCWCPLHDKSGKQVPCHVTSILNHIKTQNDTTNQSII